MMSNETDMPDLLPCPLCGENVEYSQEEITCECGINLIQGGLEPTKEFIERWNTRAHSRESLLANPLVQELFGELYTSMKKSYEYIHQGNYGAAFDEIGNIEDILQAARIEGDE